MVKPLKSFIRFFTLWSDFFHDRELSSDPFENFLYYLGYGFISIVLGLYLIGVILFLIVKFIIQL